MKIKIIKAHSISYLETEIEQAIEMINMSNMKLISVSHSQSQNTSGLITYLVIIIYQ